MHTHFVAAGRFAALCAIGTLAMGAVLPASAGEAPDSAKDLTAVLALLGKPCGQVVRVEPRGDNDNVATCSDGNRYRVYVNADGRVVADKL
ncbi:MAG: hypothetical protein RL026_1341 [Pseudomonadota bacterium]|jgi:hypothetical protein